MKKAVNLGEMERQAERLVQLATNAREGGDYRGARALAKLAKELEAEIEREVFGA